MRRKKCGFFITLPSVSNLTLNFSLSRSRFSVTVHVLHKTHVLQMVIYEVQRGREMGDAWGGGGSVESEEEEVLKRGRNHLLVCRLTQSCNGLLLAHPFHITLQHGALIQFKAYMYNISWAVCPRSYL